MWSRGEKQIVPSKPSIGPLLLCFDDTPSILLLFFVETFCSSTISVSGLFWVYGTVLTPSVYTDS
jgi:hypothetical protein